MTPRVRRAAQTLALTLGAVVLTPLVLLGALYLGAIGALGVADLLYALYR